jgi:hypothetical protein
MSEDTTLPVFIDHGDQDPIPLLDNVLYECSTADMYEDMCRELHEKKVQHRRLLGMRTTVKTKLSAYDACRKDLLEYLTWLQTQPDMSLLVKDIENVVADLGHNMDHTQLRNNIHRMVQQETATLRCGIGILQGALDDMRVLGDDDDKENVPPGICGICYDNHVTHCFVPCGHTCCSSCLEQQTRQVDCFMCRSPIQQIIKLYF